MGWDLAGKRIVVTGGTQGLGEATARVAAEHGAAGITVCGRSEDRGVAVARALEDAGCPALYVRADLMQEADCRRVVAEHDARFGGVDALVNAAASTARGTLDSTTTAEWDAMFALNVRAPFVLMQESARRMQRDGQGGSIINVLSVSAHGGQPYLAAYCASKGALATLTKNVAHALRGDRIRVNGINVGWMATPNEHLVQLAMGQPEDWLARADAEAPFGRIIRPEEVAELIAYLIGGASLPMTGALIDFDQHVIGASD